MGTKHIYPSVVTLLILHADTDSWHGKDAVKFIESMVVGDIAGLKEGETKLSLVMNENGGIVDDTVIANAGSHMYVSLLISAVVSS